PPNPNKLDSRAQHAREIFSHEGCEGCHTPPLYTSNKLTPAEGFIVSAEDRQRYGIIERSVGTDPELAMRTRKKVMNADRGKQRVTDPDGAIAGAALSPNDDSAWTELWPSAAGINAVRLTHAH